jgi:2-amino-4-hydroxy-6-hydroxymethyldihydropteridine diphosphokinase
LRAVKPTVAFIGLGSNLSHPRRQLARAAAALAHLPQSQLVAVSPNYRSAPMGTCDTQPDYVNAVVAVRTALGPRALLRQLQAIERRQHRRREPGYARNAPRTLDLDLLLYGARRIRAAHLVVPHPRMHERAFVLRPLLDIAPAARIPGRGLARRHWFAVRGQRIARTRKHFFR